MNQESQRPVIFFFLVLLALILYLLFRLFQPFLHTLILSLILAGLFYPVYRRNERLLKGKRIPAALITCLLVFLTVFLPLLYFAVALSNETLSLYLSLSEMVSDGKLTLLLEQQRGLLSDFMERFETLNLPIHTDQLEENAVDLGKKVVFLVYENARVFISNLAKFFVHFLFLLVILYYLFLDGVGLRRFLFALSPLPEDQEQLLVGRFNEMVRAVLLINGLGGLIQGVLGGLVFWVLGLPSPLLWGSLMAVLAFLPIAGIQIVSIPWAVYLLLTQRYLPALFFIVGFALLSFGVEYIMKPRMVGQQAKMHTLLIFFSIIGGLSTFGILGILYGPLIMTAFLSLVELYKKNYEQALMGEKA